jgi:hypothetical protein
LTQLRSQEVASEGDNVRESVGTAAPSAAIDVDQDRIVREIVRYMLTTYSAELGTSERRWQSDLKDKAKLAPNTAAKVVNGSGGIGTATRQKLAKWFSTIRGWEKITGTWLDAASLDAFLAQQRRASGSSNGSDTVVLELELPRRHDLAHIAEAFAGHYISYRFAFETQSNRIAREVVSFVREGDKLRFEMSYKLGGDDAGQPLRMFKGYATPIGASLMGLATSTEMAIPGWQLFQDRARCLFLRHEVEATVDKFARFGMVATTKTDGFQEPCAACVLMFKVGPPIDNLDEFRERVTVIRPLEEIMKHDFAPFTSENRKAIAEMIENIPRQFGRGGDKVLKLWYDRFIREMKDIIEHSLTDPKVKLTAPWTGRWRDGLLAAPAKR